MPIYSVNSSDGFADRKIKRGQNMLRRTFERNIAYRELDKYEADGTITEFFPIHIWESSNKQNSYMNFIAHPDNTITYGDVFQLDNSKVIVIELNSDNRISEDGMVYKCNDNLKWKDDGDIFEQECFIDYKGVTSDDSGRYTKFASNRIIIYTQITDKISNLEVNQEFVFGKTFKNVYKILNLNDSAKDGLAIVTMELVQSNVSDDLDNNIADNPNNEDNILRVDSTLDDSYYIITPDNFDIRLYSSVTYSIEHYDNSDTIIPSTFNFDVTGVLASSYNLIDVTNTGLTLESVEDGGNGILEITDNATLELINIDIELRGLF